jgi:alpha-L-arabinofuranosidase
MYAMNKGTNVLSLTMDKKPVAGQEGQDGLFASAVYEKSGDLVIVKVVNTSKQPQPVQLNLLGMKGTGTAETITLNHNGSMDDENTLDQPEKIVPKAGTTQVTAGKKNAVLTDEVPAMSFRLYKIKR